MLLAQVLLLACLHVSLMSTWSVSTFVLAAPPILHVDARELLCCGLQLLAEAI